MDSLRSSRIPSGCSGSQRTLDLLVLGKPASQTLSLRQSTCGVDRQCHLYRAGQAFIAAISFLKGAEFQRVTIIPFWLLNAGGNTAMNVVAALRQAWATFNATERQIIVIFMMGGCCIDFLCFHLTPRPSGSSSVPVSHFPAINLALRALSTLMSPGTVQYHLVISKLFEKLRLQ